MGRKKSSTSEMNVAEKQSTPLASRLSDLITDSDALRKYLDVSAQAINQYKLGISRPSLENLCKIADFYNVSIDWLVGRPGSAKSFDTDINSACQYTGLSETNISALHGIIEAIHENPFSTKRGQVYLYAINEILSSKQFLIILVRIWESYCIEHQRSFGGFGPKYPDEKEAAQVVDEARAKFEECVSEGLTKARIVSGDVAISVLLNDAREAIVSIAKDIVKTDILEKSET